MSVGANAPLSLYLVRYTNTGVPPRLRGRWMGHLALWPPKPPMGPRIEYTVLMNTNETTMTLGDTITSNLADSDTNLAWFTALNTDIQADIMEMVNENGYPLDDIRDFVETYGPEAYANGHYVTWCQLEEEIGADTAAIEAFVEEFGIDAIDGFEDAYMGEFDSEADFAEEYTTGEYNTDVPDFVVVDWQATWDAYLSYYFEYNDGYVFRSK